MAAQEWQKVGSLSDIPKLGARKIRVGDMNVGVFRTADDKLFALEDVCPHLGGPLSEGIVHGKSVTCPLHNMVIDLESGQSVEPDPKCVRSCKVRRDGDAIYLNYLDLRELVTKRSA